MLFYGLGIGLYLLIGAWSAVLLYLFVCGYQRLLTKACVVLLTAAGSAIFLLIPQEPPVRQPTFSLDDSEDIVDNFDEFYYIRITTFTFVFLTTLVCLGIAFLHKSEAQFARALPKQKET